MIKSLIVEFSGRAINLEVSVTATNRVIHATVEGRTLLMKNVAEGDVNQTVLEFIERITAEEIEATVYRQTVTYRGETFEIEVWPVGRAFKSCVKLDGEVVCGTVAWNDLGIFDGPKEIAQVHEDEIRNGSVSRAIPKDYFPR